MRFVTLFVMLPIVFSGCGSSVNHAPKSVDGMWKSDSPVMTAHISHGAIQIYFVNGDTKSLYWKGTFNTSASDGSHILSKGDTETMDSSLMASEDSTKKFVYKNGELSFPFSILGTSKTVKLER
jgi:hypothetical protein